MLGSAGTATLHRDFPNAPIANTWYPAALANALANVDLNGATSDIRANFSSTFSWYFGTDGNTPANQVDFASVVLHEIGHGLGFFGVAAVDTGNSACNTNTIGHGCLGTAGFPTIYDRFTEDGSGTRLLSYASPSAALGSALTGNTGGIFFNGANANAANGGTRIPLHAPAQWRQGSSYSHLAESFNNTPNALMTFSLGNGESQHSPGPVMLGIFRDIGWGLEQANLSIAKSSAATVVAGTTLTYTLQIANAGPHDAGNVTVTDTLPLGTTLVSATPGCSGTATIVCNLGTVAIGATATVTISVAVHPATPAGSILTNIARVAGDKPDPNPTNNTISANTTVTRLADLLIQKAGAPDPIVLGNPLTYTISITNSGPSDAGGLTVIDILPQHVAFVPGACSESPPDGVICRLDSLASGASVTLTIVVVPQPIVVFPNKTAVITNSAIVNSAEPDPDPLNNTIAGITTTVELPQACDLGAANIITGTPGDDLLIGTPGDDVILGLGGDDRIFGQGGNDCLDGGDGHDLIGGDSGNDLIFGRSGRDTLIGSDGDDLIIGDTGEDTITGSRGNDLIFGDAGSDQISGNDGHDLIAGGDGGDQIDGGAGNDRIFGGDGGDRLTGGTGDDTISGDAGNDRINGNGGDDTISGGAGSDQIDGGSGNDTLAGDAGDDRINGSSGDDLLDGGLDQDRLDGGGDTDSCLNGEALLRCEG